MECLSSDGLKMSTPTPDGYQWVIVIIDNFSRFVQVYPAKDCSAETAVACILRWMSTFGTPSSIRTDNASQFYGKYEQLLRLLQIRDHKIQAYSHEENGSVEVANREILRHLRALILETKSTDWHILMYLAVRIMNARVVKATGVSPQDLVFAGRIDLNRGALFPRHPPEPQSVSEYLRTSMEVQEKMLRVAEKQQEATDRLHLADNVNTSPTVYDVGTQVLVRRETPDKLSAPWLGPFEITHREERIEGDVYTCLDPSTNRLFDFRAHLLRPYVYDSNDPPPAEVANMDHQAYVAEAILQHRFSGKLKKAANLELLVKWQGYDAPEWQTYSTDTRKLKIVHEYLAANNLRNLIPANFRSAYPSA